MSDQLKKSKNKFCREWAFDLTLEETLTANFHPTRDTLDSSRELTKESTWRRSKCFKEPPSMSSFATKILEKRQTIWPWQKPVSAPKRCPKNLTSTFTRRSENAAKVEMIAPGLRGTTLQSRASWIKMIPQWLSIKKKHSTSLCLLR